MDPRDIEAYLLGFMTGVVFTVVSAIIVLSVSVYLGG
jgi:hypothetical protein